MATPRPTWAGQLKISLVSFPVRLYPATASTRPVELHQIHEPTGKRVHYETVVDDVGKVPKDEIVKGYEYSRGHYVTLDPDELDEVRLPARHTLDMVQFVKADEISPLYFDRPYFVVPEDKAATEAFAVVRDAMREQGKIGLGEVVFAGKEHLAAIRPCGNGMLLETLRYSEEVRESDSYFSEISPVKTDAEQLDLAKELITRKSAKFDPGKYHDNYIDALKELIAAKVKGQPLAPEEDEAPSNVVNLMEALKRSVSGGNDAGKPAKKAAKKSDKKPAKPATKRKAG